MSNGIGANPLNAISKVYLEQIAEKKDDTYLEPDMKKRQKNNEKARKDMEKMGTSMKNPHFEEKQQGWDAVNTLADAYKEVHQVDEADSLAAMQARREKRLAAQRKREGTTASGRDFGHDYSLSDKQQKARRDAEFKAGLGTKKEEYVTELSKKTLGSYVKKASSDAADRSFDHGASEKRQYEPDAADEKETSKLANRQKGIKRAVNRLTKEEIEVDEAVKGQDTEMRKAASAERKSGDKRLPPSAGKGYADQQKQSIAYMNKLTKEALDPVGKEDGDVNNDGKKDSTDSYLMKRRKAIGNAMKKKMKEHRELAEESLTEVMTDEMDDKPIKEKKVKNKITINPKLGEAVEEMGGTLIEEIEVDEFDVIVETVYEELIEEGFSEDEVEHGIETALNTLDEGYYDSAVAASKAAAAKNKGETPKKSMKDRLKSAAKRAIMGVSKAAGKAVRAKAAVQAAPGKAKAKVTSMADRVKRIAKAGYASGRGPVEKKSKTTSYRGAGVGRKEKIGEESVVENVATGKAKRAKRGGIAQKVGASEVVSNKEKDAAYAKKKASDMASDAAAGDAAHKAATDKGMSPAEAMMRKKAAERKAARERARMMK